MAALLLSAHVLAAIVFIGPITVAASTFPRHVTVAAGRPTPDDVSARARADAAAASAAAMHRITRVYAALAALVPVLGVATAAALGVLGQGWVIASMILTALAAVVLWAAVVPQQRATLASVCGGARSSPLLASALGRLAAATGIFNLTWAVVVVLMILRPGSTTGV